MSEGKRKVLAVGSGGGHFVQVLRLRPAWEHCEVHYLTTIAGYASDLESGASLHLVNDANRNRKLALARLACRVFLILLRLRPSVIISCGAAPGYFALRFGKLLGGRTVWIDCMSNGWALSMSGQMARKYADLWLTQWPDLARPEGPRYEGSVL